MIYNDDVEVNLNINNSYINIPLNVFVRPFKQLELKFGGYMGILVNCTANGKMRFGSKFNQILKYNYYSDNNEDILKYKTLTSGTSSDPIYISTLNEEGDTLIRSTSKIVYAYSQFPSDDAEKGDLYKVLDFGLNAGINYYVNSSLYFGVNVQYGLKDITNNNMDRDLSKISGNMDATFEDEDTLIFSEDSDKNLNFQISIGFRF